MLQLIECRYIARKPHHRHSAHQIPRGSNWCLGYSAAILRCLVYFVQFNAYADMLLDINVGTHEMVIAPLTAVSVLQSISR
jgi:hypothetical protein